jgi:acetyltransferase-like isoleucine patch superfamily enzyme
MKEQIKQFKKGNERVLLIEHHGDLNVMYDWVKIRNPLLTVYNNVIINIGKGMPLRLKNRFYCLFLRMKIGKNVAIAPGVELDPYHPELITIEDNVTIGWKTNILCHEFTPEHIRLGRVLLKKGAFIGAFCSIRSGITIGERSMVAMDSLVNKDIPDNELWGGIPIKSIKKLR